MEKIKILINGIEESYISKVKVVLEQLDVEVIEITEISEKDNDLIILAVDDIKEIAPTSNMILIQNLESLNNDYIQYLEELSISKKIFSWINSSISVGLQTHVLIQAIEYSRKREDLLRLAALGNEITELTHDTQEEIKKIKKIHEQLVPIRSEKAKGLQIYSKYAAGESIGGEFFDYVGNDHEYVFTICSSTSYLFTSALMNRMEFLADMPFTDSNLEKYISNIFSDANQLELKGKSDRNALDLMVVKIDLNSMNVSGYQFGKGQVVSTNSENNTKSNSIECNSAFIENSKFSFKLDRGEKLLFLSPGVSYNTKDLIDNVNICKFIETQIDKGHTQLLNELFFKLKENINSNFLKYDASAIYIEVDKHALFKV